MTVINIFEFGKLLRASDQLTDNRADKLTYVIEHRDKIKQLISDIEKLVIDKPEYPHCHD